ncbi:MAG TPA: IPT/TIG domain-containing protein [Pedobacter sp.]
MGTQVTITGTNLGGATSVSFGGTAATSFTVNSSTIIATVGTGTSGNVSVTTVGGTANLGGFSFIPAPTITSFTPSSAAIGTQVTITGTNLSGVTSVSFGGTAASSFTVNSSTSITATVGSGNSGNVSVTTAGGMANLAGFGFIPAPTITSFTPSSAASGSQVTITGTNLSGATDVSFGGTAVTSFTVDSSTSITALVGAGTSRNVSVTTAGGTANLAGFTFIPAPTITSFTPSSAAIGTQVTITGTNLGGATAVSFGGSAASSFTVNSATSITATVGAGPGGDVTLITLNGTVSKSGFIYVPSIISNSSTTFKMGGSVILKEPTGSVPGYSYQWAKDGVDIPNATAPSYTAIESGSYAVSMVSGSTVSTSAPVLVKAVFKLPVNNFQIVSSGETCKTSNNGSFVITAGQPHNYNAVITGPNFNQTPAFVNNSLSVTGLLAGKYTACVTVSGQADYKQCFDIVVTEPEDLSVYTSIDQSENKIRLALKGGTNYNVEVNGTLFQTSNDEIYLPLSAGKNNLKVSTDQRCQGIIERVINVESRVLVYPNPFDKVLNLRLSNNVVQPAIVEIWTLDGKRAFIEKFINHYGILQLDLSSLRPGIYSMKLTVSNSESLYKIVKK